MNFSARLETIKGVGPKTALQLSAAHLNTIRDLIFFLPRKYEDYSNVASIDELAPGKATIRAKVAKIETKRVRRGMTVTTASLMDASGAVKAVWFNQPYREAQLKDGEYFFSGNFEFRFNSYQLTSPSAEKVSEMPVQTDRILPVYRSIKGLKSQLIRKLLMEIRPLLSVLPDELPPSVVESESVISLGEALDKLHFPKTPADIELARERLGFEELFQLLLASQLSRDSNQLLEGIPFIVDMAKVKGFVSRLPFDLTNSQRLASWEIIQDLEKPTPMNRMLQGDVGSGKTVVAGISALVANSSGYQTAVMAPTEILASQLADTLSKLLSPFGVSVALLTGSVKSKARQLIYQNISGGAVSVVVGTHAIFQERVEFHSLGLVIIDEQHRFGVEQRQKLIDKAHTMPHFLAMTATPIPRSLQLTVFGDLEVSQLKEKPSNRLPIATEIFNPVSREKAYEKIKTELDKGHQAYVIAPMIEDGELSDKKSIETESKRLRNSVLTGYPLGILHGKMKAAEKEQIMQDFKDGKYKILLSTTVVEVGVDVPNATIILIESADQFGLAQLHQLRGRVGRSDKQSYCLLITSDSKKPTRRLMEIAKSNDGFHLAEIDLKLRGPGEIYGRAQHGDLNLEIADLNNMHQLERAKRAVERFVESGEDLVNYKQLYENIKKYQRITTLN